MLHVRLADASTTAPRQRASSPAAKQTSVYLLVTVMVLLGTLIYLWPRMRLVNLAYQQGALHVRRTKAVQSHKELQAELATLRQLSRIEAIARQRLGMRPSQLSQIIYVHSGQRIVVPGERR